MNSRLKKMISIVALTAVVAVGTMNPITVKAEDFDGDSTVKNRVYASNNVILEPSVTINYHAGSVCGVVNGSTYREISTALGLDSSTYEDKKPIIYVADNNYLGADARAAVDAAKAAVGATEVANMTLNTFKYEGNAAKLVDHTSSPITFIAGIPASVQSWAYDYAFIRLNPDGSTTYLVDKDTDNKTLTFSSDQFSSGNVYSLVYAPKGAFANVSATGTIAQATPAAAVTAPEAKANASDLDEVPKTGENSPVALLLIIAAVSGLTAIVYRKKYSI